MPRIADQIRDLFGDVFVLSLRRSGERRESLASHMAELGVECYSFFDATDGSDPIVSDWIQSGRVHQYPPCFRCGQIRCGKDDCNNVLIPSQVATAISHYRLWQHIADGGFHRALIIEDDVRFHPWTEEVLDDLAASLAKDACSLFDWDGNHLLRLGWPLDEEHVAGEFAISADIRMANNCYALTSGGARLAAGSLERIETTADIFLHRDIADRFDSALTILPPIASDLSWSTGAIQSEIHPKAEHVKYLQGQGKMEEARQAAVQLKQHVAHKEHSELLLVGHPECGSVFAAEICKAAGLQVGYEACEPDGVSCWWLAVDANSVPAVNDNHLLSRTSLHWNRLIHFVRNPFEAIPSIMVEDACSVESREFRRKQILEHTGIDLDEISSPIERAAWSLFHWSRLIEEQKPDLWFKIEEPKKLLNYLRSASLLPQDADVETIGATLSNAGRNQRSAPDPRPRLRPVDFLSLPEICRMELARYCATYGYPYEFPGFREEKLNEIGSRALAPIGWFRSLETQIPMTGNGKPLPWFTYSAIEFLATVVSKTDEVFEYGSGWSTVWFADKVRSIVSVEHDEEWVKNIQPSVSANVQLRFRPIDLAPTERAREALSAYQKTNPRREFGYTEDRQITRGLQDDRFAAYADEIVEENREFDIVVIDGMARRLCAHVAADYCKDAGLIVFDDTNRSDYREAYELLGSKGYRQINFWGAVPCVTFNSCTSIFVRSIDRIPIGAFSASISDIEEW